MKSVKKEVEKSSNSQRDSLVFYRSFYESIKSLPNENQAEIYDAVFTYALDFEEVELIGISKAIFTLIKPQLDANIRKYHNGLKPKKKKLTEEQTESNNEANDKQALSKTEGNVNDNENDNENENNIESYPSFDDFWKLYDKKVSKDKSEKKWYSLSQKVKEQIMEYLPKYILSTPDKQFRKDPLTFFNNQSWNDEIEVPNKQLEANIKPYPTIIEFMIYVRDNATTTEKYNHNRKILENKFKAYDLGGWIDWKGNKVTDWQVEILNNIHHWIK